MNCKFCYEEIIIIPEIHEKFYPSFCSNRCVIAWADLMEQEEKK